MAEDSSHWQLGPECALNRPACAKWMALLPCCKCKRWRQAGAHAAHRLARAHQRNKAQGCMLGGSLVALGYIVLNDPICHCLQAEQATLQHGMRECKEFVQQDWRAVQVTAGQGVAGGGRARQLAGWLSRRLCCDWATYRHLPQLVPSLAGLKAPSDGGLPLENLRLLSACLVHAASPCKMPFGPHRAPSLNRRDVSSSFRRLPNKGGRHCTS